MTVCHTFGGTSMGRSCIITTAALPIQFWFSVVVFHKEWLVWF